MKRIVIFMFLLFVFLTFAEIPLFVGTIDRNGEKYFVYEISPEFTIGPVTLGVGFTTYATDVVYGTFYFGLPSDEPSTNIINGFIINSLKFDFYNISFNYGKARPITYGLGFNVRKYLNPNTRSFDISLRLNNFTTSAHIPYELQSFIPFSFVESDSVYMGEFATRLKFIDLNVAGVIDFDASNTYTLDNGTPVKYGGSVSLTLPISLIKIGIEGAVQADSTFSEVGEGLFAGIYGNFLGILDYTAGVYYTLNGFIPRLFDRRYTSLKSNNQLPYLDKSTSFGYIAGFDLDLQPYGRGSLYLLGDFNEGNTDLEGALELNVPSIGEFKGLIVTADYFDNTPFAEGKFLDSDSEAKFKVAYPLIGEGFLAGIIYNWNGLEWEKGVFVGSYSAF
ncbi:MAG: hypothetical protein PWP54_424 [Thermosipho sp. (in: thermotogales)]|nr:hypothetical protein [Thermosipho sp. (in: thermotogales)]MDN5324640.1 hypothetical protein [Thermosipho sp. (in: thermotogales)]